MFTYFESYAPFALLDLHLEKDITSLETFAISRACHEMSVFKNITFVTTCY